MVSGAAICIKAAHSSDPGASDVGDPSWSICHPWLRETTTGIHTHNPAPKQTHTYILLNARATPTHFIDIQDIFSHRCRYSGNSFFQTPPTPSPTSHTHTRSPSIAHTNGCTQRFLKHSPPPVVLVAEELPQPILHRCSHRPSWADTFNEWMDGEDRRGMYNTLGEEGKVGRRGDRGTKGGKVKGNA